MQLTEKQIQNQCIGYLDFLEKKGLLYYFRSGSGAVKTVRNNGTQGYFKTGKPGAPDITVCYKGKFVGIEIKTLTGRISENQKQAQCYIEQAGGSYHIIRSLSELETLFKNYL